MRSPIRYRVGGVRKGRHHLRGEQFEIAEYQRLREAWVSVAHQQMSQTTHVSQLLESLGHMLRRAHQQVPRLKKLPVQLGTGSQLLIWIREYLSAAEGVVIDERLHDA